MHLCFNITLGIYEYSYLLLLKSIYCQLKDNREAYGLVTVLVITLIVDKENGEGDFFKSQNLKN